MVTDIGHELGTCHALLMTRACSQCHGHPTSGMLIHCHGRRDKPAGRAGTFMEHAIVSDECKCQHALGQEMNMETCLAPHLFEESKKFLGRILPNHMNNQTPRETEGRRGCNLFVLVDLPFHPAQLCGRLGRALLTSEWAGSCKVARGDWRGSSTDESYLNIPAH